MKPFCKHILPVAALCLLFSSCARDIIPRATLAEIYADMFLADQWLYDHSSERSTADTTLFYDPILARYGYTFEQYDKTVKHYMKDPERFSKIFRMASDKLRKGQKTYNRKKELVEQVRQYNAQFKGYGEKNFDEDTLLWKSPVIDSLLIDSLRRQARQRDSLLRAAIVRDSIKLDSLRRDSIRRHNARIDSTINAKRRRVSTGNINR